jgi:hypothetical protein
MSFDYGVITLDVPLGSQVGFWQSISAPSDGFMRGNLIHTSGYPGDKGENNQFRVFNRAVRLFPQRLEYLHDIMGGQSGSAMWVRWEENRSIVGIVTTHDDPLTAVVANTGVRITSSILSDLRRWGVAPTPGLDRPTLRRGAKGPLVKNLQARLNLWLTTPPRTGPVLVIDGDFGQRTDAAVRAYQRDRGITVDGIVGPETWGTLMNTSEAEAEYEAAPAPAPPRPQRPVFTPQQRSHLSNLIRNAGLSNAGRSVRQNRGAMRRRRQIIRRYLQTMRTQSAGRRRESEFMF